MIGIVLLALPFICLLIGIIYFLVNLWKLNQKTISSHITTSSVPLVLEDGEDRIIPRCLAITDSIHIVNSYELDEDEMRMLLYTVILKQHRKNYKIDNCDFLPTVNTSRSQDLKLTPSRLLRESVKTIQQDITLQNEEKFLWQLQNSG